MKKYKCSIPKLHEKQEALLCGKHAINNLLQQASSDCSTLKSIGKTIAREYDISPNELVNVKHGFYDVSVLVKFLVDANYEVHQLAKEDFPKISRRQSNRLIGYIFGNGAHWIAVRKTHHKGCYYVIDSLEDYPIKIDVVKNWLEQTDNVLAIKVLHKKVFKH